MQLQFKWLLQKELHVKRISNCFFFKWSGTGVLTHNQQLLWFVQWFQADEQRLKLKIMAMQHHLPFRSLQTVVLTVCLLPLQLCEKCSIIKTYKKQNKYSKVISCVAEVKNTMSSNVDRKLKVGNSNEIRVQVRISSCNKSFLDFNFKFFNAPCSSKCCINCM